MKKTLLSLLVVLTSISVSAQKFVSKTFVGSLDRQTVVSGAKKAPAKVDSPSNQRLIGYYTTDDCDNSLGLTGLPGNYKAGILLENTDFSAYVGAKVVGVRYSLGQSSTASGVYVSKVNAGQITEAATKTESNSVTGWHTTMFDTADQFDLTDDIEGLMVGFSYKQTSSNYPIGFFTNGPKRNFYVYGNIPASAVVVKLGIIWAIAMVHLPFNLLLKALSQKMLLFLLLSVSSLQLSMVAKMLR